MVALGVLAGILAVAEGGAPRGRAAGVTGTIATFAGGGTLAGDNVAALNAQIGVLALAASPSGDVYFSDFGCRIHRISAGTILAVAGTGVCGFAGDNGQATLAEVNRPEALAFDTAGNLFVADSYNCSVRRIDASSQVITTIAGTGQCGASTPNSGLGGAATSTTLSVPLQGLAVGSGGQVYVSEREMCRVDVISGGTISLFAGAPQTSTPNCSTADGDGGAATAAHLILPFRIAIDAAGGVYVSQLTGCNLRKISSGVISTLINPCSPLTSGSNGGLAIDAAGTIFMSDVVSCNVRARTATATFTIAGSDGPPRGCGFSGDGGAAVFATLNGPYDLALDGAGNLYVADVLNARIRVIYGATAADTGDTDSDGYPDIAEAALGTSPAVFCGIMRADVNGDGVVTITDIALAADYFGQASPPTPSRYLQGPPPFAKVLTIVDLGHMALVFGRRVGQCP